MRVYFKQLFHHRTASPGFIDRIDHRRHKRNTREPAHQIGGTENPVASTRFSLAVLDRLGTKHQVREIDIPLVRRHIGAFRHITHVTKVAMVDDVPVNRLGNAINFHRIRLVDSVEQGRKSVAQIEAATAAMANVEDTLKLLI